MTCSQSYLLHTTPKTIQIFMLKCLHTFSSFQYVLNSSAAPARLPVVACECLSHAAPVQYFFQDYVAQGNDTYDSLYCVTQHAGHVLPRLYLMITCASCAMKDDPSTIPSYLSDLLDFCKGIQNPMRGLFLRSFLNTSVRALLPDVAGVGQPRRR